MNARDARPLPGGAAVLLMLLLVPARLGAQAEDPDIPLAGFAVTVQADRYWFGAGDGEASGVTLRAVQFRPNHSVMGFGVGFAGQDFDRLGHLLSGEAGAGYMLGGERAALLLQGGAVGALSTRGLDGGVGGYLGAGGVFRIGGRFGARLDATRRFYLLEGNPAAWVVSVGIGILPAGR